MENNRTEESGYNLFNKLSPFFIAFYVLIILILFLAELGMPLLEDYFRATNQVLILLALLILPFLINGMSKIVRTFTLKISGQELHLELEDVKQNFHKEVKLVETKLTQQVSTAEQAFWPILAGIDKNSDKRLEAGKLIIGSKYDTSQIFFAHILSQIVERYIPNVKCEMRVPNGGSLKNFADIKFRWIDMYIDFTGTSCQYFNISYKNKNSETIIEELNNYGKILGLKWLKPLGASEDYCLVMKKEKADKFNITSLNDLKIISPKLTFSADPEFLNRSDCYFNLRKHGIDFKTVKPCRVTNRYELMEENEADVFVGYETDPQLLDQEILKLNDTESIFPKFQAIPIVNINSIAKLDKLEETLLKLHNIMKTDDLTMAVHKLNKFQKHPSVARDLANDLLNRAKINH